MLKIGIIPSGFYPLIINNEISKLYTIIMNDLEVCGTKKLENPCIRVLIHNLPYCSQRPCPLLLFSQCCGKSLLYPRNPPPPAPNNGFLKKKSDRRPPETSGRSGQDAQGQANVFLPSLLSVGLQRYLGVDGLSFCPRLMGCLLNNKEKQALEM